MYLLNESKKYFQYLLNEVHLGFCDLPDNNEIVVFSSKLTEHVRSTITMIVTWIIYKENPKGPWGERSLNILRDINAYIRLCLFFCGYYNREILRIVLTLLCVNFKKRCK